MVQRGQALVVVLLILGIAVTVGLSIVSRSITEVSVSTAEDESARALEAAEAGVERALGGVVAVDGPAGTGTFQEASFSVSNTGVGNSQLYEVPNLLPAGDAATVRMTGYGGNRVRVCWGDEDTGDVPAVEVILYYRDSGGVVRVGRAGYDDQYGSRGNGFEDTQNGSPACNGGGATRRYEYRADVDLDDLGMPNGGSPLYLRVRMLYNTADQPVLVRSVGGNLPGQASEIISTGQAGGSTQKLRVLQSDPDLPMMFDAALFSGTSLTQ